MRNADFAEWMLSQVTSRERAASTVGDLLEEISRRGVSWFWVSVAQTVWSLVWREFSADRGRMLRYGAAGAVIAFAIPWLLAVVYGVGLGILIATGTMLSMTLWISVTLGVLAFAGTHFGVGVWLGRRFPDREMAACLALVIVDSSFGIIPLAFERPIEIGQVILGLTAWQLLAIPYVVGAGWARRRRLAAA